MEQKIQLNSEVSRRYSKALFIIANEQDLEKKFYSEVSQLFDLLIEDDRFNKLFSSPLLSSKDQLNLVDNIFSKNDNKKIKVSKNIFAFLKVLASNRRLKALLGALQCFKTLVNSKNQEIDVNLTTAIPISESELINIKSILSAKTKKKLNIKSIVDKNIIGGIILQSGSNLIDASIKNKILKLNNIQKGVN
jgi:F-type H+-transporting ATPase subunit delta